MSELAIAEQSAEAEEEEAAVADGGGPLPRRRRGQRRGRRRRREYVVNEVFSGRQKQPILGIERRIQNKLCIFGPAGNQFSELVACRPENTSLRMYSLSLSLRRILSAAVLPAAAAELPGEEERHRGHRHQGHWFSLAARYYYFGRFPYENAYLTSL